MINPTQTIVPPWTGEILDRDTVVPVQDCIPFPRFAIMEIETLDELRHYMTDGAVLYVSKIRGAWLVMPMDV